VKAAKMAAFFFGHSGSSVGYKIGIWISGIHIARTLIAAANLQTNQIPLPN
jgi:hypothetical protein